MQAVAAALLLAPLAMVTPCSGSVLHAIRTRGPAKPQPGRQLMADAFEPAEGPEDSMAPQPLQLMEAQDPALAPISADSSAEADAAPNNSASEQEVAEEAKQGEDMQFKWKDRGKNGFKWRYGRPKLVWRSGDIVYEQDGVVCKGLSYQTRDEIAFKSAELHAVAVTEAILYMCDPGPTFNATHIEEIFAEAEAYAFAQAAVNAALSCKSSDAETPNTCVSYTATATAVAQATASGHSEAVALAVKNCSCMTQAVATSYASDDLFVELVADATVTAEATVCVEGNNTAYSSVWEECTSVLYAKLFAKAAAKAAAYGTCLSNDAKVELESYVDAQVTTENTPECDVQPKVNITGSRPISTSVS